MDSQGAGPKRYQSLLQVRDFRNDVILAEACRADVETYCKNTPACMPVTQHDLSCFQNSPTLRI